MHKSRRLELVSMYLSQPVLGAHEIALELEESRPGHLKGTARLDPNICSLDRWGDRRGCTKIGFQPRDAEATMTRTPDPQGHGRVPWSLHLDGVSDATVHLIEYPSAGLWYLTVEDPQGDTAAVPLFGAELFAPGAGADRAG